ncbi:ATP-binding protein [Candidatus Micrarchaeota archaeon]|nr:ATP-binding protein [Candidatus Micrarchaeota archaeon]
MKPSYMLSKEIARKMILVHPPEPRKELLLSLPTQGVYIGKTRFLRTPVFWNPSKLINPHLAIIGITGSGKSYTVKTFLTRASMIWNTNAVILDWVGEYNEWVKQAGGRVINLATERLNILDLVGLPKRSRIKQIISALDILLDLKSYPNERDDIEEALEFVYYKANGSKPTLKEQVKAMRNEQKKTHKFKLNRDDVREALGELCEGGKCEKPTLAHVVHILERSNKKKAARLLKRFTAEGSDFFAGSSTLNIKDITSGGLVCIDLHDLPSEEMRSLAGLTILQYIKELMRAEGMQKDNRHVRLFVVLDEAWKIAQDERSDVITIVREGRKYNFSLVIATQNPSDMHKTIFSNIGTVFVLRLILKEFRDYVRNSIGYSDFIDGEISKFGVGDAAVNMIFAERQSRVMTFLMDKIDGEEPLLIYKIRGGEMIVEIEREQFVRMLYEIGLNESQLNLIKSEFERGDGLLDGEQLVAVLEKFGYSKPSIISFLRQLGIDEKNLIKVFSLVRMRKATKGVVNLVLEDGMNPPSIKGV